MVRVINGANSICEVDSLITLYCDALSAADNEAARITYRLLGLEQFQFKRWNWQAKIMLILFMVAFPFYIRHNGNEQTDRILVSWDFEHSPSFETC